MFSITQPLLPFLEALVLNIGTAAADLYWLAFAAGHVSLFVVLVVVVPLLHAVSTLFVSAAWQTLFCVIGNCIYLYILASFTGFRGHIFN